jgi:uncharacterized Zn-finger protein
MHFGMNQPGISQSYSPNTTQSTFSFSSNTIQSTFSAGSQHLQPSSQQKQFTSLANNGFLPGGGDSTMGLPSNFLTPALHGGQPGMLGEPLDTAPQTPSRGRTPVAATGSEKNHNCNHPGCAQSFKTRFSLKRHLKKHNGARPHCCPFEGCDKRFAEKSTLKRHVRVHTREKPFTCDFCHRSFADHINAKRHMATHAEVNLTLVCCLTLPSSVFLLCSPLPPCLAFLS